MPHLVDSYRFLSAVVGRPHALRLSRAEIAARVARVVAGPAWRHVHAPSIGSLVASMPSVTSHGEVLEWFGISANDQSRLLDEFQEVSRALDAAYVKFWPGQDGLGRGQGPSEWGVGSGECTILHLQLSTLHFVHGWPR